MDGLKQSWKCFIKGLKVIILTNPGSNILVIMATDF